MPGSRVRVPLSPPFKTAYLRSTPARAATVTVFEELNPSIDGVTSRLRLGNAALVQAGANPAPVTASHGPGIEPCRYRGDVMLDA